MYLSECQPVLRVACRKCGRGWQFDRERQIRRLGDITTVEARWRITKACPHKTIEDPCQARWLTDPA